MKKYWPIIKDAIILIAVSTTFVFVVSHLFKGLKKTQESDSLVTAIMQASDEGVKEALGEEEFKQKSLGAPNYSEYLKVRTNRTDEQGRTALMWASYLNVRDEKEHNDGDAKRAILVDIIVNKGADVNAKDNDNWTSLMWASWSGLDTVAAKLLQFGADVSVVDTQGNTALTIAAQRGNVAIVKLLLEKGADRTVSTKSGKTAQDLAKIASTEYPDRAKSYDQVLSLLGG